MDGRRVYLDTSVIGGIFDEEFQSETKLLFKLAQSGHFRLVTSVVTLEEIMGAPSKVRDFFGRTFASSDLLGFSAEAGDLAEKYVEFGVVTERFLSDAQHVAVCVLNGIDILASWNFKHLANLQRENAFNGVNLLQGCRAVRIVTPKSLVYGFEKNS